MQKKILGFCEHIQMDVSYFCCGCSRGTTAAYGEYVMPNSTDGYRMLPEAGDPSGQHGSTFELVPAAKVDVGEAIRGIIWCHQTNTMEYLSTSIGCIMLYPHGRFNLQWFSGGPVCCSIPNVWSLKHAKTDQYSRIHFRTLAQDHWAAKMDGWTETDLRLGPKPLYIIV